MKTKIVDQGLGNFERKETLFYSSRYLMIDNLTRMHKFANYYDEVDDELEEIVGVNHVEPSQQQHHSSNDLQL